MSETDALATFESETPPKVNDLADQVGSRTLARQLVAWSEDVRGHGPVD